jgi:hypothetical protein
MKTSPSLLAALFGVLTLVSAQAQDKKPNVLVIWGDDIGTENISYYNRGMMGYQTPNIDRVGKEGVFFTDYSLEQNQDENVLSITASVMALGNGRRALDVLVDALSKTATNLTFATEYPDIALFNQIDEQSFASSLVKPTVVTSTIDFAQIAVAVMNESTRTSELHGYFRSRVLEMAAVFYAKSMMFNQ